MKKSKHFRKDVILARVIAAVLLLVLIVLLILGISLLKKTSGDDKNSQNSQNTQNTEGLVPEDQDTEELGTEEDTQQNQGGQNETPGTEENNDTTDVPDKVYVETTAQIRLRKEPNTSCATLSLISEGIKLEMLESLEGWYKVIYDGQEGYVSATYVRVVEE